jgi:hypothetical protein
VEVITPVGANDLRPKNFLLDNAAWVLDQMAFLRRLGSVHTKPKSLPADTILFRGRRVRIEIIRKETARMYGTVQPGHSALKVRLPMGSQIASAKPLESWLRRQARQDITARLTERAKQMRVKPGRVSIRGQRTKWGGCSRRRNLSFNWRLVMAPPAVLDYIVVHELAHLIEPYHSIKFWLIVRSHCPHFERHKRWLRSHQQSLMSLPHASLN